MTRDHHHQNWFDLHLYVLDGHLNWSQDDLLLVSHLSNKMQQIHTKAIKISLRYLYPGFDIREVVDSGENSFPLVLLCKLSVWQLKKHICCQHFVTKYYPLALNSCLTNGRYEIQGLLFLSCTTHPINCEGRGVDEPTYVVVPLVRSHAVPQLWWLQ